MKIILLAILSFSFAIVSCARSQKPQLIAKCEQMAKSSEDQEKIEPLKRHNRW